MSTRPPLVYFIHTDHIDTPRIVVDKSNNVRWRWMAEPFGTTAPETNPQSLGAFAFPLRMPGQYADTESGLFYNYFRYYDSSTGRFPQSDLIGLAGGINTYLYVEGNPVSYIDPDGKVTLGGVIVIGGIIYGAYKLYDKFHKFDQEIEACKRQCENTAACGDPERTSLYNENAARCITTCKANATIGSFFGIGKGPTGPKSPDPTPNYFKPTPPAFGKP